MSGVRSSFFFWVVLVTTQTWTASLLSAYSWCPLPPNRHPDEGFHQKADRFWVFQEQSNRWIEISTPYHLMSCFNDSCTKVASIEMAGIQKQASPSQENDDKDRLGDEELITGKSSDPLLSIRKGVSLTKMSEASIWVTGQSGSIYERFWNGLQWVVAPHELPPTAGHAISVFIINKTILALSEHGKLHQLQLNENAQTIWIESMPILEATDHGAVMETSSTEWIKSGVASHDGERLYFSTMNGSLLELNEVQTMSSAGELYEFGKYSKPLWKKHIWSEASTGLLTPSTGCILQGLVGSNSLSLFLLNKDGFLVERRLHQRKWKWITHGAPKGQSLTAIMPGTQTKSEEKVSSLFFSTATGFIFQFQLPVHPDMQGKQVQGKWINHMHPQHAKVARGIPGIHLQLGRIVFPLDDGRLGELHLSSIGGEHLGPNYQLNMRRKSPHKYEWSILEAPETEGWNAEYCTDERGPTNCIAGMKDMFVDNELNDSGITTMKRRHAQECEHYLPMTIQGRGIVESEQSNFLTRIVDINFRLRAMHAERSFFVITESGSTLEYLYAENVWLWLRHEHSTPIKGALGKYNGSLFLVDAHGNLLIRERNGTELSWINCTDMKKGRQVATGPPWDAVLRKVTNEDALFFISKKGRLLQFTVALRKFKWKDCHHPPNTKIVFIVDQEALRMNIVFVLGADGHLYQYNRVTALWHQHCQPPHLVLQISPGTAMRPFPLSLTGSLFMILEKGGLVEYHWDSSHGWKWIEHGTPQRNVTLVSAPGPSFGGFQLFVIGSDGHVYQRYMDQKTWRWANHGFPYRENAALQSQEGTKGDEKFSSCNNVDMLDEEGDSVNSINNSCDEKVAAVRPIKFSEDSVIFELFDGRLAELRRAHGATAAWDWEWSRIIGTPSSPCLTGYWTALAS